MSTSTSFSTDPKTRSRLLLTERSPTDPKIKVGPNNSLTSKVVQLVGGGSTTSTALAEHALTTSSPLPKGVSASPPGPPQASSVPLATSSFPSNYSYSERLFGNKPGRIPASNNIQQELLADGFSEKSRSPTTPGQNSTGSPSASRTTVPSKDGGDSATRSRTTPKFTNHDQTVLLLDWDDTLCPSSYCRSVLDDDLVCRAWTEVCSHDAVRISEKQLQAPSTYIEAWDKVVDLVPPATWRAPGGRKKE